MYCGPSRRKRSGVMIHQANFQLDPLNLQAWNAHNCCHTSLTTPVYKAFALYLQVFRQPSQRQTNEVTSLKKKHVHDYTPHGTHFQIRAERLLSQKMLKGLTINLLSTYTKRINTTFTEYTYMYMSIHHLRTNIYCYNLTANNTGNIMMQPLLVSPRVFSY